MSNTIEEDWTILGFPTLLLSSGVRIRNRCLIRVNRQALVNGMGSGYGWWNGNLQNRESAELQSD